MRTRQRITQTISASNQTTWRGFSTSTRTNPSGYTDNPARNLEWANLSGFHCRFFIDVAPTHDFLSRRAAGELIMNPMQSVSFGFSSPKISQSYRGGRFVMPSGPTYDYSFDNEWSSFVWSGMPYIVGPHPPLTADRASEMATTLLSYIGHSALVGSALTDVQNAAVVRFRTDYADMVDILLSDRDATSLLPGLLKQVFRLTHDFERCRIGASLADISQLWLAYRYGVRPLLYDIRCILHQLHRKHVVRRSFRAKRSDIVTMKSFTTSRYLDQAFKPAKFAKVNCVSTLIARSSFHAGITADLALDEIVDNGFCFDRFLPTIWDLTPYSFLVDWVVNVSDWLTNLAPSPKVTQQIGFVTHACNISVQGASQLAESGTFPVVNVDRWLGVTDTCESSTFNDPGYSLLGVIKTRNTFNPSVALTFEPINWFSASHVADLLSITTGFKTIQRYLRKL